MVTGQLHIFGDVTSSGMVKMALSSATPAKVVLGLTRMNCQQGSSPLERESYEYVTLIRVPVQNGVALEGRVLINVSGIKWWVKGRKSFRNLHRRRVQRTISKSKFPQLPNNTTSPLEYPTMR
jgi:hypothetical protein